VLSSAVSNLWRLRRFSANFDESYNVDRLKLLIGAENTQLRRVYFGENLRVISADGA
jgi:hypothetical protein